MNNLLKFIARYQIVILFIFLELLAVAIIVQNNKYHKAGFLNTSNFITGNINTFYSNFTAYLHLKDANKALAEENARLHNQLYQVEYMLIPHSVGDSVTTGTIQIQINDTIIIDTIQSFEYVPALTISNSINKMYNYVFLDKGKKDGVKTDMGVINQNGVVGIVVNVSNSYSVVMPLVNEKSKLSVKIKNQGYFGTLNWKLGEPEYAYISEIPKHVQLNQGDSVITSGYSQIFPEGKLVGFVEKTEVEEGSSFLNLKIKLAVDFAKLHYVYVLNNLASDELKTLSIEQ